MNCGALTLKTSTGFAFKIEYFLKEPLKEGNDQRQWPIAIIFPGSGFIKMTEREGEPIALAFSAQGYQTLVVHYNLLDQGPIYPHAVDVGLTAVQYAKQQAATFHGDSHRIVTIGFSSGGHVVTLMNALGQQPKYLAAHGFSAQKIAPAAQVLGYPVIDLKLGFPKDQADIQRISPDATYWQAEKLVSAQTPPTFIWHTFADAMVPVINSLTYATALAQHQVPLDLHLFTKGKHGLCLATVETARYNRPEDIEKRAATWFELALSWLAEQLQFDQVNF